MSEVLTTIQTDHGEVKLSPTIIKKYLVSGQGQVSDQEITMYLALCKFQKLNPFLREAYLIKFGNEPATIVTGKEVFTKRASKAQDNDGWENGITVLKSDGSIERRVGIVLDGEILIGGWAKVYRKGQRVPIETEPSIREFMRYKKDGSPMANWKSMPETMIKKVALVQALREAYPESFQGLYSQEEMPVDTSLLDPKPVAQGEPQSQPVAHDELIEVYDDGDPELPWNQNKSAEVSQ